MVRIKRAHEEVRAMGTATFEQLNAKCAPRGATRTHVFVLGPARLFLVNNEALALGLGKVLEKGRGTRSIHERQATTESEAAPVHRRHGHAGGVGRDLDTTWHEAKMENFVEIGL
ncbi:hypothetical protein PsorP6_011301 [Peronosclerospora sorghi]|uniref:Uncharacterized protein n=1 Tax=Peronosclerospora sorghi TaxID=230839 RepID=A0ACC0WKK4_9STRA|nr:hypothetical protein PsorP6_011301 [Peronosclerospora sorghi]